VTEYKFHHNVCSSEILLCRKSSIKYYPYIIEYDESNLKIYVFLEELYGILEKAHKETGHGGRDRMIKHLNNGL
jgi:hypothetical protein